MLRRASSILCPPSLSAPSVGKCVQQRQRSPYRLRGTGLTTSRPVCAQSILYSFLPREDPISNMPKEFAPLDSLLKRMTIKQPNGTNGLLAVGQFGDAVNAELKHAGLDKQVQQVIESKDQVRTFGAPVSSAYSLTSARRSSLAAPHVGLVP